MKINPKWYEDAADQAKREILRAKRRRYASHDALI
jgi:hypothetical protein